MTDQPDPQEMLERNTRNLSTGLQHAGRVVDAMRARDQIAAEAGMQQLVLGFIRTLDDDAREQLVVNALIGAAQLQAAVAHLQGVIRQGGKRK